MAENQRKSTYIPLLISLFVIIIGIICYYTEVTFLEVVELKTIDARFASRGPQPTMNKVVLAVIDEKSLDMEGKWVWPRSKFADLITILSEMGAKVIGFDIGFLEPDEHGSVQTIRNIQKEASRLKNRDAGFEHYLEKTRKEHDYDQLLADAIKNAEAKVVLGYFHQMSYEGLEYVKEEDIQAHKENSINSKYKLVHADSQEAWDSRRVLETVYPESNIALIANSTEYAGYFNMLPDLDGVFRLVPGSLRFQNEFYAPLSIKCLEAYRGEDMILNLAEHGISHIEAENFDIFTTINGEVMVNFRGGKATFPHISITDILNGRISKEKIQGKIVLVGATAIGIFDLRPVPFEKNNYPGLEIHANVIDSVLARDFLKKPSWGEAFDLMAIIMAGLILGLILPRVGVIYSSLTGTLFFIGHILVCQSLFSGPGWILNMIYPLMVLVFTYIAIIAYRYVVEEKEKRFIRGAFSTYMAPAVVKQLEESPEKLQLGGENREITAFFSDVQGFTGISEKLEPPELVELLNEFLTEMTDIVYKHEGTVDKFEGDAIIAFFGAPNDLQNHAEKACDASIDMQKRLEQLRVHWASSGQPELRMRIGLYTGYAVVGNMGSKTRMDYTMMGDTVNTAARLEGVNKIYGNYTLVGETTYRNSGDTILFREIDSIYVIGKKEPVRVFEPIGYYTEINEEITKAVEYYTKGLYAYRGMEWDKAINLFGACLQTSPYDGPSKTMMRRCNEFKENPPEKGWDGVFSMTSK